MTLRVAVSAAMTQDFRCRARNRSQAVIRRMFDLIAHPFERATSSLNRIARALPEDLRSREHVLVPPVDNVSGFEETLHSLFLCLNTSSISATDSAKISVSPPS